MRRNRKRENSEWKKVRNKSGTTQWQQGKVGDTRKKWEAESWFVCMKIKYEQKKTESQEIK